MLIVVADLPEEGRRFGGTLAIELEADPEVDALAVREPSAYNIWAIRDGNTLQINGSVSARVEASCSRCAQRFSVGVKRDFEASYRPAEIGAAAGEPELDEGDMSLDYYRDGVVDARQLLAEQILLALPMKLLCADDCRGLCSQCGANRNLTECDCKPQVDPRWSSLEALRDRL